MGGKITGNYISLGKQWELAGNKPLGNNMAQTGKWNWLGFFRFGDSLKTSKCISNADHLHNEESCVNEPHNTVWSFSGGQERLVNVNLPIKPPSIVLILILITFAWFQVLSIVFKILIRLFIYLLTVCKPLRVPL